MLLEIFLDGFLGFRDIDCKHDQTLARKLLVDPLNQGFFVSAVRTPRGPELEQDDFPFDRCVVEIFSRECLRAKAWGRLVFLIASQHKYGGEKKY